MSYLLRCLFGCLSDKDQNDSKDISSENESPSSKNSSRLGQVEDNEVLSNILKKEHRKEKVPDQSKTSDHKKMPRSHNNTENTDREKKIGNTLDDLPDAAQNQIFSSNSEDIVALRSKTPVITRSLPQFEPEKKSRFALESARNKETSTKTIGDFKALSKVSETEIQIEPEKNLRKASKGQN